MKDLLTKIYTLISAMLTAFADYLKSEHQKSQQKQLLMQEYKRANYIRSVMYEMQKDLIEVFRQRSYYFLASVLDAADIRVSGYKIHGNTVIYNFQLAKSTSKHIDTTIAKKIMQNMNEDIAQTTYRLSALVTLCNYPFLSYGLKVVGVKDAGLALEISVITNYPI